MLIIATAVLTLALSLGEVHAQDVAVPEKQSKAVPQALWIVDGLSGGPNISIFQAARLDKKTGEVPSAGFIADINGSVLNGLIFDSSHNLWMSFCSSEQGFSGFLVELSVAGLRHLVTDGRAKFSTIIEDPVTPGFARYLDCPGSLRFDPAGNLWVEVAGASGPALLEYSSDEFAHSSHLIQPIPTAIINTSLLGNFRAVLTFDQGGNLWRSGGVIAEQNSQDEQQTIVEYTAAQLATGAQTDPNQTLIVADTSVTGALNAPTSITFDGSGNLWVAFGLGSVSNLGGVEMFAAADLDGAGTLTPTPAVTIDSAAFVTKNLDLQSLDTPDGLAFDNEGDLWVANQSSTASEQPGRGSLVEFAASQLSANGNPLPERGIVANQHNTNLAVPIYITFGPALP